MDWAALIIWIPTAAVVAMAAVACAGAVLLPERAMRRRYGLLVAVLCGAVAIGATIWQQRHEAETFGAQREATASQQEAAETEAQSRAEEAAKLSRRLHVAWQLFAEASKLLPGTPATEPPPSFDTANAGFAALAAEADDLEKRIAAFRLGVQSRSINDATAAGLAAYLRPRGSHRVVVSCVPKDEEAYLYANRVATILRQAGWDAVGPETTNIFTSPPAIAISLYTRGGEPSDSSRLLTDAFTRFNIPFQSRIASNDMIPDADTLELFVGKKP